MLKNRICLIILILALALPLYAEPEDDVITNEPAPVVNTLDEDNMQEETLQEFNSNSFKQPVSKKKVAKKFLLAMLGVGVSSFVIYFGLTVYNKIRDRITIADLPSPPEGDKSLDTPENLSEAVKAFIDKTKWE